jgi:hypothetical protein
LTFSIPSRHLSAARTWLELESKLVPEKFRAVPPTIKPGTTPASTAIVTGPVHNSNNNQISQIYDNTKIKGIHQGGNIFWLAEKRPGVQVVIFVTFSAGPQVIVLKKLSVINAWHQLQNCPSFSLKSTLNVVSEP